MSYLHWRMTCHSKKNYESEGFGSPSVAELESDLAYLKARYTQHQAFARIDGKPVIYVYNADETSCEVADRWAQAANGEWYVVLKVFGGYKDCANQPDSWHQYGPAVPVSHVAGNSYNISAGFWRADETSARLARDPSRWAQNVRDMVAFEEPWQLITSYNEWGEGTATERCHDWASDSGYGIYLDALHSNGADTGDIDNCPNDPNKTKPGECGCGVPEGTCGITDADGDGIGDAADNCPNNANANQADSDTCIVEVTREVAIDSDDDGVPDDQDDFPYNADEYLDTDGDGEGNNADTDDDNDGMPDDWELTYGLNPLEDDAGSDPDGDDISNIDEFNLGTAPNHFEGNFKPDTPALLIPENGTTVSLTPQFETGDFSDPNVNDDHSRTQWMVIRAFDGVCVFDVTSNSSLTLLTLPKHILEEDTEYIWKVRFIDNHAMPSEWSEEREFTSGLADHDTDKNGVPDVQEVSDTLDLDADGTMDIDQPDRH